MEMRSSLTAPLFEIYPTSAAHAPVTMATYYAVTLSARCPIASTLCATAAVSLVTTGVMYRELSSRPVTQSSSSVIRVRNAIAVMVSVRAVEMTYDL